MTSATDFKSHLSMLAGYHGWANQLLLEGVAPVSPEHYRADAGLFFGSIHRTLNHLLLADRAWYGRFVGRPESYARLDLEIEPDRAALAEALAERHLLWKELIAAAQPDAAAGTLHYTTTAGEPSATPWLATVTHVFNHATHHRGQVTAALTRYGYACPEIDLIYFVRQRGMAAAG
ncbi:DinB family protein [Candidimonas humi]|uniref:DinB family protein n=1 Tax=Candidimonas humi TaxID=683355 RepID=A0ABV8NZE0_9BURK|nr:DinB family protein [Candidimonas humi]MBV6304255.1 DinB family protein [Candidimonas humi]